MFGFVNVATKDHVYSMAGMVWVAFMWLAVHVYLCLFAYVCVCVCAHACPRVCMCARLSVYAHVFALSSM